MGLFFRELARVMRFGLVNFLDIFELHREVLAQGY